MRREKRGRSSNVEEWRGMELKGTESGFDKQQKFVLNRRSLNTVFCKPQGSS
jgi:hypothetical protein